MFALKLDGSGTIERFSQDFKAELPLADLAYERCAMAVPNRDGSLVLFSSDWGDASSNAIIYDYVAGVQVLQNQPDTAPPSPPTNLTATAISSTPN